MDIKTIKIISVGLTQSLKIFTNTKEQFGDWTVEPDFNIKLDNENNWIQHVEVLLVRTVGTQHASIKVLTCFELGLSSNNLVPTTENDFIEYASMQLISLSHARAFFIRETIGTKYSGALLPMDSFYVTINKLKLAIANINREN